MAGAPGAALPPCGVSSEIRTSDRAAEGPEDEGPKRNWQKPYSVILTAPWSLRQSPRPAQVQGEGADPSC